MKKEYSPPTLTKYGSIHEETGTWDNADSCLPWEDDDDCEDD